VKNRIQKLETIHWNPETGSWGSESRNRSSYKILHCYYTSGSPKPDTRNYKLEARIQKPESGNWKPESRHQKLETGSIIQKPETGG
jgi:hypothetical protein